MRNARIFLIFSAFVASSVSVSFAGSLRPPGDKESKMKSDVPAKIFVSSFAFEAVPTVKGGENIEKRTEKIVIRTEAKKNSIVVIEASEAFVPERRRWRRSDSDSDHSKTASGSLNRPRPPDRS